MEILLDRLLQAIEVFTTYFNDSTSLFVVAVGVSIGLLVLSTIYLISTLSDSKRRRIRKEVYSGDRATQANAVGRRIESGVAPVKLLVLPTSDKERMETTQRLHAGGYYERSALSVFYFWKLILALAFGLGALVATTYFPTMITPKIVIVTLGAAFVGSLLPSYILDKRIAERKRRIVNAFPDMLDLLVACSEAGLGLNAALQRVSTEIEPSFPDLGGELALVNAEILAGVERTVALKGLALRTDIPEVQGFVSMLSQSIRFGTGIAETLRIYAEDFRDKRTQKAEEIAAKIGTKMIFPLVLCFFPSFFLVAVGPAAISITAAFSN